MIENSRQPGEGDENWRNFDDLQQERYGIGCPGDGHPPFYTDYLLSLREAIGEEGRLPVSSMVRGNDGRYEYRKLGD